jgi:hypothetical protein
MKINQKHADQIDNCIICVSNIDRSNGDIIGYFGIEKVCFCIWCYSSIKDMVIKLNGFNDIDTLKQMIQELKEER